MKTFTLSRFNRITPPGRLTHKNIVKFLELAMYLEKEGLPSLELLSGSLHKKSEEEVLVALPWHGLIRAGAGHKSTSNALTKKGQRLLRKFQTILKVAGFRPRRWFYTDSTERSHRAINIPTADNFIFSLVETE